MGRDDEGIVWPSVESALRHAPLKRGCCAHTHNGQSGGEAEIGISGLLGRSAQPAGWGRGGGRGRREQSYSREEPHNPLSPCLGDPLGLSTECSPARLLMRVVALPATPGDTCGITRSDPDPPQTTAHPERGD
ncbi:hypothetical protein AAFF_G00163050 [Aldrovandia affinis]|uniref:Uncharacterized protein n=1 Tax=Aldrovandia affinis TaxID=143900 RepID=A0AAD7SZ75_9TELE|nr:hypothetical protein AAFF_G00163050 [Aldrovandia affinis]